jgi:hypothetical protein
LTGYFKNYFTALSGKILFKKSIHLSLTGVSKTQLKPTKEILKEPTAIAAA